MTSLQAPFWSQKYRQRAAGWFLKVTLRHCQVSDVDGQVQRGSSAAHISPIRQTGLTGGLGHTGRPSVCPTTSTGGEGRRPPRARNLAASLGRVGRRFLLQAVGEAVVEEEELPVRKQAAEQSVHAVAPQQDLEGRLKRKQRFRTGFFSKQI